MSPTFCDQNVIISYQIESFGGPNTMEKIPVNKIAEIPDAEYHQHQMKAGENIIIGSDADNPVSIRGISREALCKHLFISGTPGSGKTVAGLKLALELNRHEIPFRVIDPAKTE